MKTKEKLAAQLILVGIFLSSLLSLFPAYVNAQTADSSGLAISPVIFELNADPGDILTNQIKIYNPTKYPQTVKMKIEDFKPIGDEGDVVLENPDENTTFSLAAWTTASPELVIVEPEKQEIITFVIKVPENAEPGGHYGSIVASISGGVNSMTGSSVGSERGALVLLRVSGDIEEKIVIDIFETNRFQEFGPVNFDLKFRNTGNVHVIPAGFITITDLFGNKVAQLEIPQHNVIPDALRQANTIWDKKDLVGRYTATVVATYGSSEKQTITQVYSFTVFPWKRAAVIGGAILVVLVILYRGRKRISAAFKILVGRH